MDNVGDFRARGGENLTQENLNKGFHRTSSYSIVGAGVVAEPEAAPLLIAPVLEVVAAEGAAGLQVQPQDLREGPLVKVDLPQTQAQPSLNIINM